MTKTRPSIRGFGSQQFVDDDCDGWVDEDFVAQGDVYVSELMILPKAVAMETGQWLS